MLKHVNPSARICTEAHVPGSFLIGQPTTASYSPVPWMTSALTAKKLGTQKNQITAHVILSLLQTLPTDAT